MGRAGYEEYALRLGSIRDMPKKWDDLTAREKEAWGHAAAAIVRKNSLEIEKLGSTKLSR